MSGSPSNEATEFITNSGAEVPKATIVKPITRSETLFFLAKAEAPSTSQFAPKIRPAKPKIINKEAISISISYSL